PLTASYVHFDDAYVARMTRLRGARERVMAWLGRIAETRTAAIGTLLCAALFAVAFMQSQQRHVGHRASGAPELRADSRFNQDAASIVESFDLGLDVLTVVFQAPKDGCYQQPVMAHIDQFAWHMQNA